MQRFVSPQLAEACVFPEPLRASRLAGHALGPYAVPFDRPMISLNLSIALSAVGRSFYMGHSCDTYEFFEVSGDELGASIRSAIDV